MSLPALEAGRPLTVPNECWSGESVRAGALGPLAGPVIARPAVRDLRYG